LPKVNNEEDDMIMYEGDIDLLRGEGWEVGAYHSAPGGGGWFARHATYHPEWLKVYTTPCEGDSFWDDEEECFWAPDGPCESVTEVLLQKVSDQ
jgi:hypothetical protein